MSRREITKSGSRLQKVGTSISRTNQSQITRTDSGTVIAGTSRISQTTIRPPVSRVAGPRNGPPAVTGAARVRMAGAPSSSRPAPGASAQQVTKVKLSNLPGKPKANIKTVPSAKGRAGTCPPTCSNQLPSPGPFTAEVEAGRHVPPGLYFHPMKGKVTEDVNSPEKLRWKLGKYTPTSLSHFKVENLHPFKQDLAPLRKQHPDIVAGVFRSFRDLPETDFESVEQLRQQRLLNQSMNPNISEDYWTVGLREAMDLEQGEMETEEGLMEYEQSTIDRNVDGRLGSSEEETEEIQQDYISPPRQAITLPETHYHMEQRAVPPARMDSPKGPIEAKQTFHIERQMGASPHGAMVDTTMIGTRTVSPGQAEQIEITKRDRIPPPRTPPSGSKRQSPSAFPGRAQLESPTQYPSPPQFQPSPDRPQLGSPTRYPSPPQFQPSPGRAQLGSPTQYPSPPQFQPSPDRPQLGSPTRYPSPPQFQQSPDRAQLGSPTRYPSPPQFQQSPDRPQPGSPTRYQSPPQFQPSPDRPQLGSPTRYQSPPQFQPSPDRAQLGSPTRYPSPGGPQLESPGRYPSPPQYEPSPKSQCQENLEYSDLSESMAVYPGSPQRSLGSPERMPSSPTRLPSPPISPGTPIRVPSPSKSPGSASPSPGGPLDISIPIPSSPENATIDVIQDLIDEEQIDFQTSSTLSPQLQDKLDRIRGHSLLVETLQEIVPGDEVEEDLLTKSDVLASMMYSEERGVIDTGSSPKKTYNALFGANAALAVSLEGERSITVSPAAPAPLQDIVVPVGQADVDDIAVVNPEISHFVASTEEMPKGDAYSSSVQNTASPVTIPLPKAPIKQGGSVHVDEDGGQTMYIPRGELEEQKAPWDIDLDSLEDLVGGQMSLQSPMRSDESIHKTIGRFEYILDLERPKHYSCVQLRGTQRPPWFPGYYYVMPHTASGESPEEDSAVNYVKQGNNLERVFAEAWNIFKPQTVGDKSEVVLL